MNDGLVNILRQYHPVSPTLALELSTVVFYVSKPGDIVLVRPPEVPEHLYFIISGFAMAFTHFDQRRYVESFYKEGQVIFVKEFLSQSPASVTIVTTRQSEMIALSFHHFSRLVESVAEANSAYRELLAGFVKDLLTRIKELQTLDAFQRFEKLRERYANIERLAPQEAIASYLGIAPPSLSRIKRTRRI